MFRSLVLFFVAFFILEAGGSKSSAIAYLNSIRQEAGLIKLTSDTSLGKAAVSHAKYLLAQQKYGHYEKKGHRGYTGRTPSQRALHAGYLSRAVMENVSVNAKNYQRSIDTLLSAIYHRFVFLNFDKNEMGAGSIIGGKHRKIISAFVYLLGSSKISRLCQTASPLENGIFYIKDLCSDDIHIVPQCRYEQARQAVRRENSPLVLFPYPGEKGVPTVFYTEHPHPLPGSKMSGYPISVQFNPAFYTEVRLKKFRLYDAGGKRVTKVKIITFRNDVNHRFTPLQFALMPLKRLRHAERYQVEFEAVADGERVVRHWKFSTRKHVGRQ